MPDGAVDRLGGCRAEWRRRLGVVGSCAMLKYSKTILRIIAARLSLDRREGRDPDSGCSFGFFAGRGVDGVGV